MTTFWEELIMIKKNFSFDSKDQDNTFINSLFLNFDHSRKVLKF